MSDKILTKEKIDQIIWRIAYEIIEHNLEEELVLVGVDEVGGRFAKILASRLKEIANVRPGCYILSLDKLHPLDRDITIDGSIRDLKGKSVILCDDVLNSGKTLAYGLSKILSVEVKKVETAVLVMRSHRRYPVYANYKGYELSTTIHEHVTVHLDEGICLA